jgi:hypothetical protein
MLQTENQQKQNKLENRNRSNHPRLRGKEKRKYQSTIQTKNGKKSKKGEGGTRHNHRQEIEKKEKGE